MRIRDSGISPNWLEQLIGHWLSLSRVKRWMSLQTRLCLELDHVARMQVTSVHFSPLPSCSRFLSQGSPPLLAAVRLPTTLRDTFYLICVQWEMYQLSWGERIFIHRLQSKDSTHFIYQGGITHHAWTSPLFRCGKCCLLCTFYVGFYHTDKFYFLMLVMVVQVMCTFWEVIEM